MNPVAGEFGDSKTPASGGSHDHEYNESRSVITFDERDPDNLKDTLIQAVEVASKYDDVFSAREGLYEKCLQYAAIDPQEVIALTFGIFRASQGDTRMAVIGGANTGRDADTLGSLNGQLCGALNGVDSAPQEWLEGLRQCSGWEKFHETAVKMTELVVEKNRKAQQRVDGIQRLLQ